MNEKLLAIDVGTQSVRAIVFDLTGQIVAQQQIAIEPYFSQQPGWAEQDADLYWQVMGQVCQALWAEKTVRPEEIHGLSLTTQRATMVCVGADNRPLRPAIVWMDKRHFDGIQPLGGLWGLAFRMLGLSDTVRTFQTEAPVNWISCQQPELWAKTEKYVLLSGWLNFQLTGEWQDSVGSQVGYIPFDYKKQTWAAENDWKWQALPGIRPKHLPHLVPPGSDLAPLTQQAAQHLGLPHGLPVVAAAADKACEVLGAGCLQADQACLSFGTTATINTTVKKYVEVERFIPPFPSAIPNAYNTEVQIYRGFWMVSWFKRQFAHREEHIAQQQGINAEALFDELLDQVPPGSMGLTLQPYWSPGVRDPGPEAKGAIIGFGDVHTRAHVYRAILEGLAYALREGSEKVEKRSAKIKTIRVAGGGSQSRGAMQLTADIFNHTAERPHVYETSALGAAINCAVGQGLYGDYATAVAAMTRVGDVFEPNQETAEIYQQLYQRVYKKMYQRLQPLYQDIRDITGYPA
ncbi:MAG: FGGY-family carbohydrate kinase [Oceanococcus sp.]